MRKILLLCLVFIACKPTPEFYINGKAYYTRTECIKSHTEVNYGYHYGYNILNGKFEYHFGMYHKTICDEEQEILIEIK